jgi:hypothetical protein
VRTANFDARYAPLLDLLAALLLDRASDDEPVAVEPEEEA